MINGNNLGYLARHRRLADERDVVPRDISDILGPLQETPTLAEPFITVAITAAGGAKPVTSSSVTTKTSAQQVEAPTSAAASTAIPLSVSSSSTTSSSAPSSTSTSQSTSTTTATSSSIPPLTTLTSAHTSATSSYVAPLRTNIAGGSASSTIIYAPTSTNAASSSGVSTVSVVGGVAGGLLALAGLVMLVMFCMRRSRRRSSRNGFNASDFRRSAVLVSDTPARPPTMIERSIATRGAASYGATDIGDSQQNGNTYGTNTYNSAYRQPSPSFAPGQIIPSPLSRTPTSSAPLIPPPLHTQAPDVAHFAPYSPTTGNPNFSSGQALFSPSAYGASPFSPVDHDSSRAGDQYAVYAGQPNTNSSLMRAPSAAPSYVSRQPSRSGAGPGLHDTSYGVAQAHYAELDRSQGVLQAQYANLDRASVTPFQAAQYAEIARQLNTDAPTDKAMEALQEEPSSPTSPAPAYSPLVPHDSDRRTSDPFNPSPPTPAYGASSRVRIDSTPPMLPDLPRAYSPVTVDFASSRSPPVMGSPHSPLSGAGMSYPTSAVAGDNVVPAPPPARVAPTPAEARGRQLEERARPDTMYTVYDPEDAYGGF
jgi:hypothetical protein